MNRIRLPAGGQTRLPSRRDRVVRRLATRHAELFAGTVRYLFGVDEAVARAVTESVRQGHPLDAPLDAALHALTAALPTTETSP